MKKTDKSSASDWIEIALRDWERVKRNLRGQDAEAAGFFLQQSLEKYLKAFLFAAWMGTMEDSRT